jgi:uncharacterized Rossmann fold enzyme
MNFAEWEPVYEAILAAFGFPRAADEAAREELAELFSSHAFDRDRLRTLAGETVVVAGAAPSLPDDLDRIGEQDVVIGASTAVDTLLDAGIEVDLMTTDLDKNPTTVRRLTAAGVPVAIHAHGDNRTLLREVVPDLPEEHVLATTQAAPRAGVENYGGFTDGDRAAFLADGVGARKLKLVGWGFEDSTASPIKRRKLAWAERLLYWLETRREEAFDVLENRRKGIDRSALPVE